MCKVISVVDVSKQVSKQSSKQAPLYMLVKLINYYLTILPRDLDVKATTHGSSLTTGGRVKLDITILT